MSTGFWIGLTALVTLSISAAAFGQDYDRFGGWPGVKGKATGFFHLEQIDGRWWFITPEGNAFVSKGVNHVTFDGDSAPSLGYSPYKRLMEKKHASRDAWAQDAATRLRQWGFNTVGSWSSKEMEKQGLAYSAILDLAASTQPDLWLKGLVADVFDPAFETAIRQRAAERCTPRKDDPTLIGYYSDNEMRWGKDWRDSKTLLESCLAKPEGSPARLKAQEIVAARRKAGEPVEGDEAAFQAAYAERYFSVCQAAITAADPNHMVLGCRFAGSAPEPVLKAMAPYVTVVSWNDYDHRPPMQTLRKVVELTGKPVMITEFSFKAADSGLPNTKGAGKPVETQQQRAELFTGYVTELLKMPEFIGFHWFQYADQPPEGRFDGENSNFGLVDGKDEPWTVLLESMKKVNAGAERIHAGR